MRYKHHYETPEGFSDIIMESDGESLTALLFEGSRGAGRLAGSAKEKLLPVFLDTVKWLDIYFSGREPDFAPKYNPENLTPFRKSVICEMLKIPYGDTVVYSDIAKAVAEKNGVEKMSAQAVGGAVGANPICIIIPCHRVVGKNGSLTGYGGGIQNKAALLKLEGAFKKEFFLPDNK